MKVYVVEAHDEWNDCHYVHDIFVNREAAIFDLQDEFEDLVYHERGDYYCRSNPDSTIYFYIRERIVKN